MPMFAKVVTYCIFHENRWRESNSFGGDVNSDYSDLDSISEAADTTNTTNVGSSTTNSIPDTSHARGLGSRVYYN